MYLEGIGGIKLASQEFCTWLTENLLTGLSIFLEYWKQPPCSLQGSDIEAMEIWCKDNMIPVGVALYARIAAHPEESWKDMAREFIRDEVFVSSNGGVRNWLEVKKHQYSEIFELAIEKQEANIDGECYIDFTL